MLEFTQSLLSCNSFLWIKLKHLSQQVGKFWRYLREELFPFLSGSFWQWFYILDSVLIRYVSHIFGRWRSQNWDNSLNLIQKVLSWKQSCFTQQLSRNAANRPYIDRFAILAGIEYNLRSSVPSGDNIFSFFLFFKLKPSGQPKIAYFQQTIFILC